MRLNDNFYNDLYYGQPTDNIINGQHEQDSTKKSQLSSRKRTNISDDDHEDDTDNDNVSEKIDDTTPTDNAKRRRHDSSSLIEISDSNKEFLERYKRRFEYDENQTYELYSGICSSSLSSSSSINKLNNNKDFDSCTSSNDQQENASTLFTYHSLAYDQICARCTCVSSILRNLSFILGNDIELVKCKTLIGLLARLLLLRHGINHNHMSDNQSSIDETVNQNQLKVNFFLFFYCINKN